jgi:putative ABC transport system substrate-binding protein
LRRAGLLIAGYAVFFSVAWAGPASAPSGLDAYNLRIAVADGGGATRQIVAAIRKRYPTSQVLAESTVTNTRAGRTIDIAIGPAALRALLENGTDGFIISIFTSSQAYRGILEKAPKARTGKVTAVFAEPSPADQFQLISRLYKRRVRVAMLVSETTAYLIPSLSKAAGAANIELRIENVDAGESATRALNRVTNAAAILAIPDNNVYNTENIRSILDTTYRRNQAIVGFSPSMVRAGVLASAYSDVDDIVAHLGEMISEVESTGLLPMPQYPKYFQTQINDSVARSLNVVVDEQARALSRKPGVRQP